MNNQITENYQEDTINKKIRGNAVASYLMIFISGLFLLNKNKPALSHPFVKSHTKTAFFIHTLFLAVIIIFNFYHIFSNITVPGINMSLNFIFSTSLFVILFITLLYGIYKANKGELFTIGEILSKTNTGNLIEIKDSKIKEEGKLTIILAYIPFIGYYITSKLYKYKSPILKNITKINSLSFFIIILFYIIGYNNISNLLILIYIILTVFSSIQLIINDNFIKLNLKFIPTIEDIYIGTISFTKYIVRYLSKNEFKSFSDILKIEKEKYNENNLKDLKELEQKQELKFPLLSYIPVLNLVYLFKLNTKYKNHIINGVLITIIFLIIIGVPQINNNFILLLLFPISFGMGYINRLDYKIYFLYDIYKLLGFGGEKVNKYKEVIKEKQKEEKNISLKVGKKTTEQKEY